LPNLFVQINTNFQGAPAQWVFVKEFFPEGKAETAKLSAVQNA